MIMVRVKTSLVLCSSYRRLTAPFLVASHKKILSARRHYRKIDQIYAELAREVTCGAQPTQSVRV